MARPTLGDSVLSDFDDDPIAEDQTVYRNARRRGSYIHDWVSPDYGTPVCKKCHLYIDDDFIIKTGGQDSYCPEIDMNPLVYPDKKRSNLKDEVGF